MPTEMIVITIVVGVLLGVVIYALRGQQRPQQLVCPRCGRECATLFCPYCSISIGSIETHSQTPSVLSRSQEPSSAKTIHGRFTELKVPPPRRTWGFCNQMPQRSRNIGRT